jgi:hypothetical protein
VRALINRLITVHNNSMEQRALLENPIVAHFVKFLVFYGTGRFITVKSSPEVRILE